MRGLTDEWLKTEPPKGRAIEEHLTQYIRERGLYTLAAGILTQYDRDPRVLNPRQSIKDLEDLCGSWETEATPVTRYGTCKINTGDNRNSGRIPTGYPTIDKHIRGGLGSGEFGAVVAPPKSGKTTHLINIGANAALLGFRVLHISLEIHESDVIERLDMCVGGYAGEELRVSQGKQRKARAKLRRSGGEILIVDRSHERFTPSKLALLIERNMPVDLVIVDYLSKMRGDRKMERYEELGDLAQEVRRLSAVYSVPIWTALRTTRQAIGMRSYGPEFMAESILPAYECDVLLLHYQTVKEKEQDKARLKLEYTRGSHENPTINLEMMYYLMRAREI